MKLKKHFLRLALFSALAVGVVLSSCSQNGDGKGADTNGDAVTGTVISESPTKLTCTDADGGVYTFTETTAPTVNANIRAGEEQKGGTFTYTINKVVKFSGIYTGDINQSTVTLTLKITKSVDSANVLIELADPETTLFNITPTGFATTIPELPVVERREVFGFFGPEWLINYVMKGNSGGTYTDRAAGNSHAEASRAAAAGSEEVRIRVMSFTEEVPGLIEQYQASTGADWGLDSTIIATTNGLYQPTLNEMLENNEVDIFAAEAAFVLNYSKGWYEEYALPYKKLIEDFDEKLTAAQIAPYVKDIGSNSDGDIVALGYQSTGCCFIYRRSLAKEIFETDEPAAIAEKIGADTGNFAKFFEAAEECKKHNVSIMSSLGDIWRMVEASATKSWIDEENDKLYIDSSREAFLDIAKQCIDNGWVNNEQDWTTGWYADMKGKNGSYGDWAVCAAPVTNFWGGTWIFATKQLLEEGNEAKKAAVAKIIEYITLNTGNNGILYKWANGSLSGGTKDSVQSAVVMNAVDGTNELCGGQDIHKEYLKADKKAPGNLYTTWDEYINSLWLTQVRACARGDKSRNQALADFKADISNKLGFDCAE